MNYYLTSEELYHHGILGEKWGVRRYLNYDGSYTQAGLKRYNTALDKYEETKKARKQLDSDLKKKRYSSDEERMNMKVQRKLLQQRARKERKEVNKHYRHLKQDKLGDEGKELYSQGHRITDHNNQRVLIAAGTIALGSVLDVMGKNDAATAVYAGGTAIGVGLDIVHYHQDKRLRAYYGHTSNY